MLNCDNLTIIIFMQVVFQKCLGVGWRLGVGVGGWGLGVCGWGLGVGVGGWVWDGDYIITGLGLKYVEIPFVDAVQWVLVTVMLQAGGHQTFLQSLAQP